MILAQRLGWFKNPVRFTRISAGLLLAILFAVSGFTVYAVHRRELREAKREMEAFDDLLAKQTAETFRSVGLLQNGIVEELQRIGVRGAGDLARLASSREIHDKLQEHIAFTPQLDALILIDADGFQINSSRSWPAPHINFSDLEYFKGVRGEGSPSYFVSQTLRSRTTGAATLYLSKRLQDEGGHFAGLVLAAMRLNYFETLYRDMNIPDGSSIAIWRLDGLLLARYPLSADIGRQLMPADFNLLQPGNQRTTLTSHTFDGQARLIVSTRLPGLPIVASYARTLRDVLQDWWDETQGVGVATLVCAVTFLSLAALITQQFRTYEATTQALAARETAERGLREAEGKLLRGQKLEAVGRLTAGVAHDFNNLLTIVRANAELLMGAVNDNKATRRIAMISQAADRGAVLTRQLMAFSRQQVLSPSRINLNETLSSISELLRSSVGSQVELRMQLEPDLWPAYADTAQFEQAVLNLIINARDALNGDGTILIETSNVEIDLVTISQNLTPGPYVSVTVADTGSGMTAEVMSRAFDPFFTTKEQGKGTGLGLSQAVGFARQSDGDVLLESSEGAGTRATIMLPRAPSISPVG